MLATREILRIRAVGLDDRRRRGSDCSGYQREGG
jgi:hypothetical protein